MAITTTALLQTDLPLNGKRQGKVRDIYEATLDDNTPALLIIASDRISAFDVVMPNGIPGKGTILTQISQFWFNLIQEKLGHKIAHHLIATNAQHVQGLTDEQKATLDGRVMVCKKAKVIPIECVVRGYLAGSGWKEYQKSQSVCGVKLPSGLKQCSKLPEPIFTPATKEETGHDENISFEVACQIAGEKLMNRTKELSLAIYQLGHDYAAQKGIILADTKFEFGIDENGKLLLIDEVLTPDSSRFWPANEYQPGRDQDSFDKQYVRNHLEELCQNDLWNKQAPGPQLPDEIIKNSKAKYLQAYELLTGTKLEA